MSEDVKDQAPTDPDASAAPAEPQNDVWMKSYQYLRTAMVGLLFGLGMAVLIQTHRQGWHLLASVSAYYYTPAQAMFVGGLVGLGACMIALKGANGWEEVFLNLGGMFAAVVAVVPTSRGADYAAAARLCREETAGPLLTGKASTGLDCPQVGALEAATRANVHNNMWALVAVGLVGLAAAVFIGWGERSRRRHWPQFMAGFVPASLVWAAGLLFLWTSIDTVIDNAHYIAAIGLLLCIVVVAVANAVRHDPGQPQTLGGVRGALMRHPVRFDRYAGLAWAMLIVTAAGGVLVWQSVVSLFWLEIAVTALFAAFWLAQTFEPYAPGPTGPTPPRSHA